MSNGHWTFGGGPAERVEDPSGEFREGLRLFVRSSVTGRSADIEVKTGPNGRIPQFQLPREWEWSSVSVSADDLTTYPLGQARELQQRPATVLRLQDLVKIQDEQISSQQVMLKVQEGQIGSLLTQVASSSGGSGLPDQVDPDSPDLPAPTDPDTGEDGVELPLPSDATDFTDSTAGGSSSLPLPEGFMP